MLAAKSHSCHVKYAKIAKGGDMTAEMGLYRAESDAGAPWDCTHSGPQLPRVIVSQARPWGRRRNVHCNSHRSSHRIRHRNGHRILNRTLTCISTWILNRISTLTSTCVRRCTTSCCRTCSAHRFRSCSASSSSRRPARSSLFSTSTSTFAWPCPNHGGGIGGVRKGTGARGLGLGELGPFP